MPRSLRLRHNPFPNSTGWWSTNSETIFKFNLKRSKNSEKRIWQRRKFIIFRTSFRNFKWLRFVKILLFRCHFWHRIWKFTCSTYKNRGKISIKKWFLAELALKCFKWFQRPYRTNSFIKNTKPWNISNFWSFLGTKWTFTIKTTINSLKFNKQIKNNK